MSRSLTCARPGCQGTAVAWLTYDYGERRAWLDGEPGLVEGDQWGLCADHAGRLRPPRGWDQVDRRVTRRPHYAPPTSLVS